jgi:hypothetical protein
MNEDACPCSGAFAVYKADQTGIDGRGANAFLGLPEQEAARPHNDLGPTAENLFLRIVAPVGRIAQVSFREPAPVEPADLHLGMPAAACVLGFEQGGDVPDLGFLNPVQVKSIDVSS